MRTPDSHTASPDDPTGTVAVTSADIAAALRSTSQWVRVFVITLAAISLFQLLAGVSLVTLSGTAPPELSGAYWWRGVGNVVGAGIAIIPIIKLASFVRHASKLRKDNRYEATSDAFGDLRVFWAYVGVVTVLESLVLVVVVIIGITST